MVRFDLFYPGAKLDLEFHGDEHCEKLASDTARDAAIKTMGYSTMVITSRQYDDFLAMAEIARTIADMHGIHRRKEKVRYTPTKA